jgi:hypothetical protein
VAVSPDTTKTGVGSTWVVLDRSGVAVAGAADANENALATVNIPALQANSVLRVTMSMSVTNNANVKTARIRFSGAAGTIYVSLSLANTAHGGACVLIANRAATNSQVGEWIAAHVGASATNNSGVVVTSSVDTSAATTLLITAQKASAGDTMQLESYLVELLT